MISDQEQRKETIKQYADKIIQTALSRKLPYEKNTSSVKQFADNIINVTIKKLKYFYSTSFKKEFIDEIFKKVLSSNNFSLKQDRVKRFSMEIINNALTKYNVIISKSNLKKFVDSIFIVALKKFELVNAINVSEKKSITLLSSNKIKEVLNKLTCTKKETTKEFVSKIFEKIISKYNNQSSYYKNYSESIISNVLKRLEKERRELNERNNVKLFSEEIIDKVLFRLLNKDYERKLEVREFINNIFKLSIERYKSTHSVKETVKVKEIVKKEESSSCNQIKENKILNVNKANKTVNSTYLKSSKESVSKNEKEIKKLNGNNKIVSHSKPPITNKESISPNKSKPSNTIIKSNIKSKITKANEIVENGLHKEIKKPVKAKNNISLNFNTISTVNKQNGGIKKTIDTTRSKNELLTSRNTKANNNSTTTNKNVQTTSKIKDTIKLSHLKPPSAISNVSKDIKQFNTKSSLPKKILNKDNSSINKHSSIGKVNNLKHTNTNNKAYANTITAGSNLKTKIIQDNKVHSKLASKIVENNQHKNTTEHGINSKRISSLGKTASATNAHNNPSINIKSIYNKSSSVKSSRNNNTIVASSTKFDTINSTKTTKITNIKNSNFLIKSNSMEKIENKNASQGKTNRKSSIGIVNHKTDYSNIQSKVRASIIQLPDPERIVERKNRKGSVVINNPLILKAEKRIDNQLNLSSMKKKLGRKSVINVNTFKLNDPYTLKKVYENYFLFFGLFSKHTIPLKHFFYKWKRTNFK